MTAPPRGGGLRAAGASLLDQVLAETLDPAYEEAARAKEGRPPPGPARRTGRQLAVGLVMVAAGVLAAVTYHLTAVGAEGRQDGRAGRTGSQVAVALVMAAAGLLAAVTYHLTAVGAEGRQEIRAALVSDIGDAQDVADQLTAELEQARADVATAREAALAASEEGRQALDALDAAEQMAGTVPVTGPGLLVTLAGAEADADADPVGGDAEVDPRGQVRDDDIQLVVNALWAAGAEAVSVDDQRLSPTTAIRFAGEAVLVDFRPVTDPYEIRAIGDPGTLRSEFLTVPDVQSLALIAESYGLTFELAQRDDLSLPAGRTPRLRSAGPASPGDEGTADSAPAGGTPPAPGAPATGGTSGPDLDPDPGG